MRVRGLIDETSKQRYYEIGSPKSRGDHPRGWPPLSTTSPTSDDAFLLQGRLHIVEIGLDPLEPHIHVALQIRPETPDLSRGLILLIEHLILLIEHLILLIEHLIHLIPQIAKPLLHQRLHPTETVSCDGHQLFEVLHTLIQPLVGLAFSDELVKILIISGRS